MLDDAHVHVYCDRCQDGEEEIELCAIARKGWDERHVEATLLGRGWKIIGGSHVCENCVEEDEE